MLGMIPILGDGNGGGEFVGGAIIGFAAGVLLTAVLVYRAKRARAGGSKLAGSVIPEVGEGIDLSRRYHITYGGDWHASLVQHWENVRIVGYVGSVNDPTLDKMYMRGRWLILEFEDRTRGYILPQSIISLREAV